MNPSAFMPNRLQKRASKLSWCTTLLSRREPTLLAQLVDALPTDILRTMVLSQSARLTVYATASRYPSDEEAVSSEEYEEAVRLAEAMVAWATGLIDTESPSPS
jgi:hypothetical protein